MSFSLSRWFGLSGCSLGAAAFVLPISFACAEEERELVIQAVVVEEKGEKEEDDKEEKEDGGDDEKLPISHAFAQELAIRAILADEKEEKEEREDKEEKDDDDDDEKRPAYWIGIGLEGDGGTLKIADVYPESPALKAGLKSGDILLAVNGSALKNLEQLVDSVQDSKGKTLKVKFTREGKEQVTEVKPAKRPGAVAIVERDEKGEKEKKGEKKEGNREASKPGQPGIGWRIVGDPQKPGSGSSGGSGAMQFHLVPQGAPATPQAGGGSAFPPGVPWAQAGNSPGMVRMAMAAPQSPLPDDMEVSISKKGNKPAVVVAKQGDKLWKTTENELGMLPPPAQAYASRLLGKDVIRARMPAGGNPGMMLGMSGGMGTSGMPGMGGMPGMPAMGMGGTGAGPAREIRRMELRLNKDGTIQSAEGTKNNPQVKVLPGGGIQVEIREGNEGKEEKKPEGKAEKGDSDRASRVRGLEEQRERLQGLLNKLREEVKEREAKEKK